jgi:TRAP-type mannitol/chloroaromatic compound transport system substrate-binding protein
MKRRDFIGKAGLGIATGAVAASTLSAPAIAQTKKTITIVSTWPRDFPGLGTSAQRLAARITQLSKGALTTEYFAAGEKVGAFDVFDEVASGNSTAYIAADYYWVGKHPGFAYFTSVPFGMTMVEWNAWIKFNGGQQLWDEISGEFGLKALTCGGTGTQAGGWFNKEINSADDFKGLKMRIPGLGGDVIGKLGGSPVTVPGGQIYENLVSGAIDATEWVGAWNDEIMKFYEAAKFYYTAGMHEPGSMIAAGFNAKWWADLSDTDKAIIEAAATAENEMMMSEYNGMSGPAFKRLTTEHGVQIRSFNDDAWDAMAEGADAVFEEARAHSDLANRIHESCMAARKEVGGWLGTSTGEYLAQRNRIYDV